MNKLYIAYPGGAGGNWLNYLVYCLENNITKFKGKDEINFHNYPRANSVVLSHWREDDGNDWKIFSSKYSFNLYLQGNLKFHTSTNKWKNSTFVQQFNETLCEAGYKFGFEWYKDYIETIDLHYDYMFQDIDKFCNELFALLDQSQITYVHDKQIVFGCIEEFKKTLPNPLDHFDNLDSFFWLAWCFGIMHHEKLPGNIDYDNCTKEDIVNSILPRRQYFVDYTKPYMLI